MPTVSSFPQVQTVSQQIDMFAYTKLIWTPYDALSAPVNPTTFIDWEMWLSVANQFVPTGVVLARATLSSSFILSTTYPQIIYNWSGADTVNNNVPVGNNSYELLCKDPSDGSVYKVAKGALILPPFLTTTY